MSLILKNSRYQLGNVSNHLIGFQFYDVHLKEFYGYLDCYSSSLDSFFCPKHDSGF